MLTDLTELGFKKADSIKSIFKFNHANYFDYSVINEESKEILADFSLFSIDIQFKNNMIVFTDSCKRTIITLLLTNLSDVYYLPENPCNDLEVYLTFQSYTIKLLFNAVYFR